MANQPQHPERRRGDRRKKDRGRRKGDSRGIATLLYLCLIAMIGLGAFIAFKGNTGSDIDWMNMFFVRDMDKNTFHLGKVRLGMSPDAVRKKHPHLDIASLGSNGAVAKFNFEGADYTIWFFKIDGQVKAYRMRFDQVYTTKTETEIVESIGNKHGKPGTSECVSAGNATRKCHFQWWPSGGIALNLTTSEVKHPVKPMQTEVTIIATDTYLDGKRMRIQSKPGASKRKSGEKKSPEKLPF